MVGEWELVVFERHDGSVEWVSQPESYTIRFAADGSVHVHVDCNACGGSYQTANNSILIGLVSSTAALCARGSLGPEFQSALGSATSFVRVDSSMSLQYAGGIMRFRGG